MFFGGNNKPELMFALKIATFSCWTLVLGVICSELLILVTDYLTQLPDKDSFMELAFSPSERDNRLMTNGLLLMLISIALGYMHRAARKDDTRRLVSLNHPSWCSSFGFIISIVAIGVVSMAGLFFTIGSQTVLEFFTQQPGIASNTTACSVPALSTPTAPVPIQVSKQ